MSDYASFKVPELKKLLTDRGLPQAGNKADLIARLQENDASKKGEDEIDWDDEQPAAEKPAEAAAPAAAPAAEPPAPAAASAAAAPAAPAAVAPAAAAETLTTAAEPEITHDFDIEEELKRREARAKRFGITPGAGSADGEGDDAQKLAARAARFGIDTSADIKETLLASLDSALPDRPLKRGRGGDNGARGDNKRSNSRRGGNQNNQNNRDNRDNRDNRNGGNRDNRNGGNNRNDNRRNNNNNNNNNTQKQQPKSFLDDPAERKKAEERAKRFGL